jgi:predicted aminopeptidase
VRPASAYSTGGWFPDPVLSTMLGGGDDALPELFNVIIHESVHATVLVPDQPFFNESLASYVADTSPTLDRRAVRPRLARACCLDTRSGIAPATVARLLAAYKALKTVYESKRTREQKLAEKAKIIDELVADLKMRKRPNNASLTEVRVYNGGAAPLILAHRACGDPALARRGCEDAERSDFQKPLQEDLTGIGQLIGQRCAAKKLDRGIKSAHDSK